MFPEEPAGDQVITVLRLDEPGIGRLGAPRASRGCHRGRPRQADQQSQAQPRPPPGPHLRAKPHPDRAHNPPPPDDILQPIVPAPLRGREAGQHAILRWYSHHPRRPAPRGRCARARQLAGRPGRAWAAGPQALKTMAASSGTPGTPAASIGQASGEHGRDGSDARDAKGEGRASRPPALASRGSISSRQARTTRAPNKADRARPPALRIGSSARGHPHGRRSCQPRGSAICRPASAQGITKNSPYAAHKLGGLAERPCTVTRAILIPVPGTRSTPLSSYLPEVRQRSAGRHHECHVKCHSSGTFRLTWYPVRCSKIHHDLEPPYGIEP